MSSEDYENVEEEEDYLDDGDEVQDLTGFNSSIVERPSFNEDAHKYAVFMGTSQYLIDLQKYIMKQRITTNYQTALLACVNSLFNPDVLRENNSLRKTGHFGTYDGTYYIRIFAQMSLVRTRVAATQADLIAFDAGQFEKNVLRNFEGFLTRTIGPKRERIINPEITSRSIQATEIARYTDEGQKQQQKKRGFFGFGGR